MLRRLRPRAGLAMVARGPIARTSILPALQLHVGSAQPVPVPIAHSHIQRVVYSHPRSTVACRRLVR